MLLHEDEDEDEDDADDSLDGYGSLRYTVG